MKKSYYAFLLAVVSLLSSCANDQDAEALPEAQLEFQGNNAVIKSDGLASLRFKDLPGTIQLQESTPRGEMWVRSGAKLEGVLGVKKEGSELRLVGNNGGTIPTDLVFLMNPLDIRKMVVEGKNKVLITSSPVLEHLELVTEGESELVFLGLKTRTLDSRREGKSRMVLSSQLPAFTRDSLYFPAASVRVVDGKFIYYTDNKVEYLLVAPQLKVRRDSVFALGYAAGNPLRAFYVVQSHTLSNQGETNLDALSLPTLVVTSKNEGKSVSKVWAWDRLLVTGSGESSMYYLGNPAVTRNLSGSASLQKL